jgi:hypothetical protein
MAAMKSRLLSIVLALGLALALVGLRADDPAAPLIAQIEGARGRSSVSQAMDAKWHVYPELEAAGLWTTPSDLATFLIEVAQSAQGRSNRVLSRAMAQEMINRGGRVIAEIEDRIAAAYHWDSLDKPVPR